jgi:hypothetical protein
LISEGIECPWECANVIRADLVSESLVDKMKRSGCTRVCLGVESMVPEVFASVNKGETLEDIRNAVRLFKKYGIVVQAFHIIGLPGDTYERTMRSYKLSRELGVDSSIWQLLLPFPGTEVFRWVSQNGRQLINYAEANNFGTVAFDTPEFPAKKRKEAFLRLTLKNNGFATDRSKSKVRRGLQALHHMFRYDLGGVPGHIASLAFRTTRFLLKGERAVQTRVKWRGNVLEAAFASSTAKEEVDEIQ